MRDSERLRLIGRGLRDERTTREQATSAGRTLFEIADRVRELEVVLDCAIASIDSPAAALVCDEDVALESAVAKVRAH